MSIFLNKYSIAKAIIITILSLFFLSVIFALLYSVLPLKVTALPVFANFSLGLAVFLGAYHLSGNSPFFRISNILTLSFLTLCVMILISLCFGTVSLPFMLPKCLWIFAASVCGEIGGKL